MQFVSKSAKVSILYKKPVSESVTFEVCMAVDKSSTFEIFRVFSYTAEIKINITQCLVTVLALWRAGQGIFTEIFRL